MSSKGKTSLPPPPSENGQSGRKKGIPFALYFWVVLGGFGVVSMFLAHSTGDHAPIALSRKRMQLQESKVSLSQRRRQKEAQQASGGEEITIPKSHPLAGLSCLDHGGPSDELASEMVYWEDIPLDNKHKSPFYAPNRYLTFEPDHGGWNNIRMAMETTIALAYAMGRTLVLPPAQEMYLLDKKHGNKKPHFSFADFFDMPAIHAEHNGFDIISMEEFLNRQVEGTTPLLSVMPPGNRTNWDGSADALDRYFQKNARNLIWDPNRCIAFFPPTPDHDTKKVESLFEDILQNKKPKFEDYVGKPTPQNASLSDRLAEFTAERVRLCLYGPELQHEPVVHFPMTGKDPNDPKADPRLLVHFYAFLFFENYHQDLWMKRFVRDHVRYTDEIQCAAARVVAAMREKVRTIHGRADGLFNTMHVRRGDFQYKKTRVSAEKLVEAMKKSFQDGDVVYIGTDERDKSFFEPLNESYHIYFLDDFIANGAVGKDINSNYYGMIDQLTASRGKLFLGCWFSTFTGYINRLRGYHSQKQKEPGYEKGNIMTSFYYAPPDRFNHMHEYYPVKKSFYAREFPTGWMQLNSDLEGRLAETTER